MRSILLIDDDRDDFDLLYEAFQDINPEISVQFLNRCEEIVKYRDQSFDMVLLDINMPHHDGFRWLEGIRERGPKELPVVMYTNSQSPADIVKSYDEGANLYFPKPESFLKLKKALKTLIQMDWTDPLLIRQTYTQNGRYRTFQPD